MSLCCFSLVKVTAFYDKFAQINVQCGIGTRNIGLDTSLVVQGLRVLTPLKGNQV